MRARAVEVELGRPGIVGRWDTCEGHWPARFAAEGTGLTRAAIWETKPGRHCTAQQHRRQRNDLARVTQSYSLRGRLPIEGIKFGKQIGILVEVLQIADRASRVPARVTLSLVARVLGSRLTWPSSNNPAPTAIKTAAAAANTGRRNQASQLRAGAADSSRRRARNRELNMAKAGRRPFVEHVIVCWKEANSPAQAGQLADVPATRAKPLPAHSAPLP